VPVLLDKVLDYLNVQAGEWYIDATVGRGGHAMEIVKSGGKVLGIDQDPSQIQSLRDRINQKKLKIEGKKIILGVGNFSGLKRIAERHGLKNTAGILFDLGFSSEQMANPRYGLSFQLNAPLDMRLNPDLEVTAADLLNILPEKELARIFREYGDEPRAKWIARTVAAERKKKKFKTTEELVNLIPGRRSKIHPATRVFQALRIAVNSELENLSQALPQAVELLKPGGRLIVISFHSGEDRIVKNFFRKLALASSAYRLMTLKPIRPTEAEVAVNPRSRSARMRVIEKIK
jgi:16S rRNA (cytosine1402-N4)-methyltransferase